MSDHTKSPAPALSHGLKILETVTKADGIGFRQIVESLDLPESSASRYLNVLLSSGYVCKDGDSGLYYPGGMLAEFAGTGGIVRELRERIPSVLKRITQRTANTSIFVYWNGRSLQCLGKELNEHSIVMQKANEIRHDILEYPWSPFVFAELSETKRTLALRRCPEPDALKNTLKAACAYVQVHGFSFYESESIRRIAAPVHTDGTFCGALAIGGTWESVSRENVEEYGHYLMEEAMRLSEEIVAHRTET